MGRRSQIYIRYDKSGLIAYHFQWNYGEKMISRAKQIIEFVDKSKEYPSLLDDKNIRKKLKKAAEVNSDTHDIELVHDITEESRKFESFKTLKINDVFDYDNNDGRLYIHVRNDKIKYCFMSCNNEGNPMTAEEYMNWDYAENWREHLNKEEIKYTEKNFNTINSLAALMTKEELNYFINGDYSNSFKND